MENLNVSLDDIFACKYLEVRFGRIPLDNAGKPKYYDDRLFFFQPLSEDGDLPLPRPDPVCRHGDPGYPCHGKGGDPDQPGNGRLLNQ